MRLDKRLYGKHNTQVFLYRDGDWEYQPGDKWVIRSYRGKRLRDIIEFWGTPDQARQAADEALTDVELMPER